MKTTLIIGMGRFGRHVANMLYEMNHEVMAVDEDEDRINAVLPFVTYAQIGDSTKEEFLSSLGVGNFDFCIVAIGDDFQNSLETTSLLKELGAKHVIARASREVHEKFLLRNGADEVVYPEKQLATWTAIRCTSDHILDYIEINREYAIFELECPPQWWGKTIQQLDIRKRYNINVLGVRKNGKLDLNITPDTEFSKESSVMVLGSQKAIHKYFKI